MRVISKIAPLIVIATILFLLVRRQFFSRSPVVIALQIAALVLAVLSRRSFAPGQFRVDARPAAGGVIIRGPYRLIRHPMYAATSLLVVSAVVSHWTPVTAVVGLVFFGALACRIAAEEQLLRQRYPEYTAYAQRTKRLVPFLL
jgi:protein-S-isoprenylcysteine O-methyltransferase Ste14